MRLFFPLPTVLLLALRLRRQARVGRHQILLAALLPLGCRDQVAAPAEGSAFGRPLEVPDGCRAQLASREAAKADKWEDLAWGQRFEACLHAEVLEPDAAAAPPGADTMRDLARSSALFCPEGASAHELDAPCWASRCPGLVARFTAFDPVEPTTGSGGHPGYAFHRGVSPGDGDPPADCLEDGTVELLGARRGDTASLVVRVEWTAVKGNWAHCWMATIRPNAGRYEVTWVSPVWKCG